MSNSRKLADIIESDGDITITGKMQSPGAFISNGVDNNSYNENIRLPYAPNGISVIAFGAGSQSGRPDSSSLLGFSDRLEIRNHDGGSSDEWKLRVYANKVESSQLIEAPIFRASGADVTPAGATFANTFKGTSNNRTVYFDGNGSSVSTWYGVGNKPYGAIDSNQSNNLQFWANNTSGVWNRGLVVKSDAVVAEVPYYNESQPIIAGQVGTGFTSNSYGTGGPIPFNEFWVNQGGISYNASTKRFTVPMAGVYRITCNPFFATTSGESRIFVGINNDTPGTNTHYGHAYREEATYDTVCLNSVVSLSANDYIVFRLAAGTLYNQSTDRFTQFSIEKIA